jgi:hypothetical protein
MTAGVAPIRRQAAPDSSPTKRCGQCTCGRCNVRAKRPKRYTETFEWLEQLSRQIERALPRRLAKADPEHLTYALGLVAKLEAAIGAGVRAMNEDGRSWATIGEAAGMTRQSAHERWGRP